MTTLGLPYFFEDTTGLVSGPTEFLDIYDRPPFLRLDSSPKLPCTDRSTTLAIYELGARTFVHARRQHGTPPSAVLTFDRGLTGSVRFRTGMAVAMERWLKKSSTFGSTLTRQFKGSDGMFYQWSFRKVPEHEWACVQLGTNYLVAHYDLRSAGEPRYKTSGNVLTVYENWVHLSIELLASLVIMRHIQATSSFH